MRFQNPITWRSVLTMIYMAGYPTIAAFQVMSKRGYFTSGRGDQVTNPWPLLMVGVVLPLIIGYSTRGHWVRNFLAAALGLVIGATLVPAIVAANIDRDYKFTAVIPFTSLSVAVIYAVGFCSAVCAETDRILLARLGLLMGLAAALLSWIIYSVLLGFE